MTISDADLQRADTREGKSKMVELRKPNAEHEIDDMGGCIHCGEGMSQTRTPSKWCSGQVEPTEAEVVAWLEARGYTVIGPDGIDYEAAAVRYLDHYDYGLSKDDFTRSAWSALRQQVRSIVDAALGNGGDK